MASRAKRTLIALLSVLLAAVLMIGLLSQGLKAGAQEQEPQEDTAANEQTLDIAVLSDIHVLPSDLIADTDDYQDALNSDRKIFTESTGILERMLAEVAEQAPDVLMISGDLTKDGELESHEYVAEQLAALKKQLPDIKIYVTNGNHDVNNSLAYNYNTEDGAKIPATRTTPEDFLETYAETVYNAENGVVAQFKPSTYTEAADGDKAGMLSYVAEPAEGYTVIVVDSGRYSADNTDAGTAEHQTSGQIGDELKNWVVEQAQAAKAKGNTVIGMMHHGLVEHFDMEEEFLADYLVNDYQSISAAFADAGIHYVFTGHMHANDIAAMTTEAGNLLYDIETGSAVTYPCPMRFVTFTSKNVGEQRTIEADIDTVTNLDNITYIKADKTEGTIDDLTEYAKQPQFGLSEAVVVNVATGLLKTVGSAGLEQTLLGLINGILGEETFTSIQDLIPLVAGLLPTDPAGTVYYDQTSGTLYVNLSISILKGKLAVSLQGLGETLDYLLGCLDETLQNDEALDGFVTDLLKSILEMKVYSDPSDSANDRTLIQFVNDVYYSHLSGDDSDQSRIPAYVQSVRTDLNSGKLIFNILDTLFSDFKGLLADLTANVSVEEFLGTSQVIKNGSDVVEVIPADGRTPLLQPLPVSDESTDLVNTLYGNMVLGLGFEIVEGENETTMTVKQDAVVGDIVSGSFLLGMAVNMLPGMIIGEMADDGTIEGGLIGAELMQTLGGLVDSIVASMSQDSNFADDGDTVIVTVDRPLPTVQEIAVTDFDLDYTVGDEFAGGKVLVVYSDGTTETVELTEDMMSGFDTSAAGTKTVTVTYGGKTATVEIEVAAAEAPDNGNGGATGGNEDVNADDSEGCGSAIGLGTGAAIVCVVLLAACVVILLRKRAASK